MSEDHKSIPTGFTATTIQVVVAEPNSTKHTWAERSNPHVPVDSQLVLNEIAGMVADKITLRQGDEFPVNFLPSSSSVYLELHSQTSSQIEGSELESYRSIGMEVARSGLARVTHVNPHENAESIERRMDQLNSYPHKFEIRTSHPSNACPYCQSTKTPIYVHGHYQCDDCKTNFDPCCQGETKLS